MLGDCRISSVKSWHKSFYNEIKGRRRDQKAIIALANRMLKKDNMVHAH